MIRFVHIVHISQRINKDLQFSPIFYYYLCAYCTYTYMGIGGILIWTSGVCLYHALWSLRWHAPVARSGGTPTVVCSGVMPVCRSGSRRYTYIINKEREGKGNGRKSNVDYGIGYGNLFFVSKIDGGLRDE